MPFSSSFCDLDLSSQPKPDNITIICFCLCDYSSCMKDAIYNAGLLTNDYIAVAIIFDW